MISPLRICLLAATALLLAAPAKADLLISDFNNFSAQLFPPMNISWNGGTPASDQYIQGNGFISITPVNGGDPKGDGYFNAGLPGGGSFSIAGLNFFALNARIDDGNTSSIFHVLLYDDTFTQVAGATFSASSFTSAFSTASTALTATGIGNIGAVTYFRMDGDSIAGDSVRVSLGNLSATAASPVPEPSAYAISATALLAALIVRREVRKRRAVATI